MSDTGQLPPEAQLFQTLFGFMVTRTLSAVAELNVADALRDGPRSYTDLAQAVGADQRSLHRAMRMLVSTGMFAEPRRRSVRRRRAGRRARSRRASRMCAISCSGRGRQSRAGPRATR